MSRLSLSRLLRWGLVSMLMLPIVVVLLGALVISTQRTKPDPLLVQVKQIAPEMKSISPLLPVTEGHIASVSRPAETYRFPIPLGEIGPVQPLFAGPPQYPFYCRSEESGLGQPEVDNQKGYGVPVYQLDAQGVKTGEILGYSKDCLVRSRLRYFYRASSDNQFYRYDFSAPPSPEAIAHISHAEHGKVPFIVRLEQGSINRFIYSVAMLVGDVQSPERDSHDYWNQRLIYRFIGGVGIGFTQGKVRIEREMRERATQLAAGYAVISSSANKTSHTYNILLQEDTARRVKQHFVSLYGEPMYTVGLGGSGGGIQQYLLSQNAPGLIDAGIPLYSYPDMVSQTIYGLDCDLFESYFLYRAEDKARWQDFNARRELVGLNAINGEPHKIVNIMQPLNQLLTGNWPTLPAGNSECHRGWLGMSSLVHNPHQGYLSDHYAESVKQDVKWTYWNDLNQVYGRDPAGYARPAWDNEGVQYGLRALREGWLDPETFVRLNQRIGSWVPQQQMQPESLLTLINPRWPLWLSYPGRQNITPIHQRTQVAARYRADLEAIEAAYRTGQVFLGRLDIPMLDVRHYLEHKLDMHHISASFSTRQRLLRTQGNSDNLVIWVSHEDYHPVDRAFEVMDGWLLKGQKPQDACLASDGSVIAEGETVWYGRWNEQPRGACTRQFPIFSTSRIEAGAPWSGDIFKCHRIPVREAIRRGVYGEHDMAPWQQELERVFATGVCDWSLGDAGRPQDL